MTHDYDRMVAALEEIGDGCLDRAEMAKRARGALNGTAYRQRAYRVLPPASPPDFSWAGSEPLPRGPTPLRPGEEP